MPNNSSSYRQNDKDGMDRDVKITVRILADTHKKNEVAFLIQPHHGFEESILICWEHRDHPGHRIFAYALSASFQIPCIALR